MAFDVERYLRRAADKFATHFDANCFLTMSLCSDLMDISRGYATFADGVGRIGYIIIFSWILFQKKKNVKCNFLSTLAIHSPRTQTLIIGVENDMIIPFAEQAELAAVLEALG